MTPDEFASKIKHKYPSYSNIDNQELARKIVDKYPEYASQVEFSDNQQQQSQGGAWNYLTTTNLENAPKYDPLAQGARLGQMANRGNQQLAGIIAEQGGQYEAARSARAGDALELPVPNILSGNDRGLWDRLTNKPFSPSGQNVQMGAIPSIAAAGTLATASEALMPQNRLSVAALAVGPAMRGYQALKSQLSPATKFSKPGVVAQLGQARTKIQAGELQQAIDDPSVFKSGTVAEANKSYGESAGDLMGAAKSLREKTGKVLLSESDWSEAINRPGRILAGTELDAAGKSIQMDPQTALEGVQSINRFTKNKAFTAKLDKEQLMELMKQKDQLLTFLENNGTPGMREAALAVRKAHINENLSRFMPQNKWGGTDALRTMGSGATAAGAASLALAGHPLAAIPLALEAATSSPMVWKAGIQAYHTATNPAFMGPAANATALAIRKYIVAPSPIAQNYESPK